jgi:alpha-ribazole phosphatase/probable phosphoglycerate mutase
MAVDLSYETHSITTDNEAGVATGWLPGQLSAAGRIAAAELGERHRGRDLGVIYASDLARAVQTAEIAFGASDVPIRFDPRLRECNYGRLNGMPVSHLNQVRARHVDEPFPDGQSYRDVVTQTRDLLVEVGRDQNHATVLFIAHSANLWAMRHLLEGVAMEDLVQAPFAWQPGWHFTLAAGWTG